MEESSDGVYLVKEIEWRRLAQKKSASTAFYEIDVGFLHAES
jgi:hypothetical protein